MVGAFELNNIELKIDSPLRDYFESVCRLPPAPRAEALAALSPVLRQVVAARQARRELARRVCELLGEEDEEEDVDSDDEGGEEEEEGGGEGREGEGDGGAAAGGDGGSRDGEGVTLPADVHGPALRVRPSVFPVCDGTALFALTCCANHSCAPNVQLQYGDDSTGMLLALRDLAPGEELCINYVDLDQPRQLRNADLRHYGFECTCERCAGEEAAEAGAGGSGI